MLIKWLKDFRFIWEGLLEKIGFASTIATHTEITVLDAASSWLKPLGFAMPSCTVCQRSIFGPEIQVAEITGKIVNLIFSRQKLQIVEFWSSFFFFFSIFKLQFLSVRSSCSRFYNLHLYIFFLFFIFLQFASNLIFGRPLHIKLWSPFWSKNLIWVKVEF